MIKAAVQIKKRVAASASLAVSVLSDGAGGEVDILDQNDNVIATVPAPGTYNVIVVASIADTGAPYNNSIIDNG